MQRNSFFIQTNPSLHAPPLFDPSLLFIQTAQDLFPGDPSTLPPPFIIIRRERQTFRRLPKTDTVVFAVKTSLERLSDLPEDQRAGLAQEIRAWPEDVASYKGKGLWGRTLLGWCEGRRIVVEDADLGSDVGTLTRVSEIR